MRKTSLFLKLLFASSGLLTLTACPDKHHANPGVVQTYFVRGNPEEMVAGATLNPTSPLTEKTAADWNEFYLLTLVQFPEKGEEKSAKEVLKEAEPSEGPKETSFSERALKIEKEDPLNWKMSTMNGRLVFSLKKDSSGHLQPVMANDGERDYPIDVLHWSVSKDRNYLSLLFKVSDPREGRVLVAVYFERSGGAAIVPQGDSQYAYLGGPGVKLNWKLPKPRALNVDICGGGEALIKSQMGKWNSVLRDRMHVQLNKVRSYKPFSDLNQKCIQYVKLYLADTSEDRLTYGLTVTPRSFARGELIDSDIFMFDAEVEQLYRYGDRNNIPRSTIKPIAEKDYRIALLHEMGHMLGLDHKFGGTDSVMSYDFTAEDPTPYDIKAVQGLYPLNK